MCSLHAGSLIAALWMRWSLRACSSAASLCSLPALPGQSVVMSITNWDWVIPLQALYLLFMSVFAHASAVWLIAPSTRGGLVHGEKCLFTLITLECDATVLYGCILFDRNGISASVFVLHTQGCKISEEFPKGIYCQWGSRQSLCCLSVCLSGFKAFSLISCQLCKLKLITPDKTASTLHSSHYQPQNHNKQLEEMGFIVRVCGG